jgi:hypothetical protein
MFIKILLFLLCSLGSFLTYTMEPTSQDFMTPLVNDLKKLVLFSIEAPQDMRALLLVNKRFTTYFEDPTILGCLITRYAFQKQNSGMHQSLEEAQIETALQCGTGTALEWLKKTVNSYAITACFLKSAEEGNLKAIRFLLQCPINVDAIDTFGNTALYNATACGHKDVVQALIAANAQVNFKNSLNGTPLSIAAFNNHQEIAQLLVNAGALVDEPDSNQATPLIYATLRGHKEMVELLLNAQANIHTIDDQGLSAISYAERNGHQEIVMILKNHSALLGKRKKQQSPDPAPMKKMKN